MTTCYRVIPWEDEATGVNALTPHWAPVPNTFPNLAEAVSHLQKAADYIVALDDGWQRDLTPDEDQERRRILKEYRQQAS